LAIQVLKFSNDLTGQDDQAMIMSTCAYIFVLSIDRLLTGGNASA
jgi:hypothetical protein